MDNTDCRNYRAIYFLGGGGGGGFVYLGLMKAIEKAGINPEEIFWNGTSIGAFFAAALAMKAGYRETELFLEKEKNLVEGIFPSLPKIASLIVSGKTYFKNHKQLEEIAGKFFGKKTLDKIGNLNIFAADSETYELVEMNCQTFPKLPVSEAIISSVSLSSIFPPKEIKYNGKRIELIDGGLSFENPLYKSVPSGYNGKVVNIDLMQHPEAKLAASLLHNFGISRNPEENGKGKNEYPTKGIKEIKITPMISLPRLVSTSPENIRHLSEQGYREFMRMFEKYDRG